MHYTITTSDGLSVSVQQDNNTIFVNTLSGRRIAEKHGSVWAVHENASWHRIMLYGRQLLMDAINNVTSFSNQLLKPQSND